MNIEAEINKELIKVLKEKIQLLEEQKVNSQEIINTQKEQLILSGVSQQRELFYNFITWYNAKPNKNKEKMIYTDTIEEYLKI